MLGYQPTFVFVMEYGDDSTSTNPAMAYHCYVSGFSTAYAYRCTTRRTASSGGTAYKIPYSSTTNGTLLSIDSDGFTLSKMTSFISEFSLTARYIAFKEYPF